MESGESCSKSIHEHIDAINARLEIVEKLIARESTRDCLSSGWVYMVLEVIEEIHDELANLKAAVRKCCPGGSCSPR